MIFFMVSMTLSKLFVHKQSILLQLEYKNRLILLLLYDMLAVEP